MRLFGKIAIWARATNVAPFLLLFLVGQAHGQPDTLWTQFYTGIGAVTADFIQTLDGGYAIGSAKWGGEPNRRDNDFVLVKLDSLGSVEWDSLYEGLSDSVHRNDRVYRIAQMNDGGFLLVGDTRGGPIGMAVRTDLTGSRQWLRYIPHGEVSFYACAVTSDNDIIASGGGVAWRLNDNDSGATIWRQRFQPEGSSLHHLIATSDSNFLLAGNSQAGQFGSDDFCAVKFDIEGEIEWENYYGTQFLEGVGAVTETSDGGHCLVGTQRFGGSDSTNGMIVRIDANGEEIWKQIYHELPLGNSLYAVVETPDRGFAVAGKDEEFNFYLQRVDSVGNVLWYRSFERRGSSTCQSIFLMPDGGYVLGGTSSDGAWLIRTTPDSLNLPNQVVLLDPAFPSQFTFAPPYPNPFNNSVRLSYSLPSPSRTSIRIYNQLGHQVAELYDGRLGAGQHSTIWDASEQTAGVYFCKVVAGGNTATLKVTLLR